MADRAAADRLEADRPGWASPYTAILGSRLRSQLQYRTSFGIELVSSIGVGVVELAEVYVMFHNVPLLGGLDFSAALLVFGLSNLAFSIADLVTGHLDEINDWLRLGTFDVLLLRPLPVLAQLVLADVTLKRIGRGLLALAVLGLALTRVHVTWTSAHVVLLLLTPLTGALIFSALFCSAAALQFHLVDGGEFANAFTYGGSYAAQYSTAVYAVPLRVFYTFVIPTAFTAYLPALTLLDRTGPDGVPTWFGWLTLPASLLAGAAALALWRSGVRHYQGGGG